MVVLATWREASTGLVRPVDVCVPGPLPDEPAAVFGAPYGYLEPLPANVVLLPSVAGDDVVAALLMAGYTIARDPLSRTVEV